MSCDEPSPAPAWLDHYHDEASIRAVADGVLAGSWPVGQWKHREHCVATLGFILFHPEIDLERELPGIIRRYNVAQGRRNTDEEGYHHTITLLYLGAIRDFLAGQGKGATAAEALRRLLASPIGSKDYPLAYYSRDRLFSTAARRDWVEPDLRRPDYPVPAI
jgi:hypothetical protein